MAMSMLVVRGRVTSRFVRVNISVVGGLDIYTAASVLLWRRQRYQ